VDGKSHKRDLCLSNLCYEMFPVLEERRKQTAGTLSGGEQQMLAIGRALLCKPKLLMFDEPSMGLAPYLVEKAANIIRDINARAQQCNWSNRMLFWRSKCLITPMCSKRERLLWLASQKRCSKMNM
jgi:ABC-type Na+ transport system ATPase subunit NatA